jgi:hypothetical protein
MPPKKNSEQEEAYEGQRIEAENDAVVAGIVPVTDHPGKCPTCGRDKVNS